MWQNERSWLRDRIQALLLTFTSGGLLTIALLALLLGPGFAHFLSQIIVRAPSPGEVCGLSFAYATVFVCFVVALELVYFLAPNLQQKFRIHSSRGGLRHCGVRFGLGRAGVLSGPSVQLFQSSMVAWERVLALMFWIYLMALATLGGAES